MSTNNTRQPLTLEQMEELAWESAIGHYLSDFPEATSTDDILELIENEDESVVVWEPFEYWTGSSVVNAIEGLKFSLLADYKRVAGLED